VLHVVHGLRWTSDEEKTVTAYDPIGSELPAKNEGFDLEILSL
jgi:hypothetical protein